MTSNTQLLEAVAEGDLLLAMGIRFWFKIMSSLEITKVEQCGQLLENLGTIIESKEAYNSVFGTNIGEDKEGKDDSFEQQDSQSRFEDDNVKELQINENEIEPENENENVVKIEYTLPDFTTFLQSAMRVFLPHSAPSWIRS